jgi:hypothetical protein
MSNQQSIGERIARVLRPGRPRRRVVGMRLESVPEIDVRVRTGNVTFHRRPMGARGIGVSAAIRSHDEEIAASISLDVVRSDASIQIEPVGDHLGDPDTTVSCDIDVWVPEDVLCRARVSIGSISARGVSTSSDLLRCSLGPVKMIDCAR